jgi:exopolysaccharide biosynthesis polyprenyl glycosylphosphotransferase
MSARARGATRVKGTLQIGTGSLMLKRSSVRYITLLYGLDMVLTAAALYGARWLRIHLPYGRPLDAAGAALPWPLFAMALVIWSITLSAFRVYEPDHFVDVLAELQTLVAAITVAIILFAGVLYLSYRGLSRLLFLYFYLLDLVGCVVARVMARAAIGRTIEAHRRGVLILGAGDIGQRIARSLASAHWMGLEVVGYLDDDPDKAGCMFSERPVLGTLGQAREIASQTAVQEVVIALPLAAQHRLANLVSELGALPVNIKIAPDYSDLALLSSTWESLGGVLLVGLKEPAMGPLDRLIKRAFDLFVSAPGLLILAPLMALIALAVRLTSPGPTFYGSCRVGEGGRLFVMHKFRTMFEGADQDEEALIRQTADGRLLFDKREDDPRVTPVGKVLRRYSLDELPQLLNVLKGEMSLVGPRPELPALVAHYEPWQQQRFNVPQGITGWWQISGRSSKAKYLHVEDDLYYIRHYSLLLDWQILWRTLGAVLKGKGAF